MLNIFKIKFFINIKLMKIYLNKIKYFLEKLYDMILICNEFRVFYK